MEARIGVSAGGRSVWVSLPYNEQEVWIGKDAITEYVAKLSDVGTSRMSVVNDEVKFHNTGNVDTRSQFEEETKYIFSTIRPPDVVDISVRIGE